MKILGKFIPFMVLLLFLFGIYSISWNILSDEPTYRVKTQEISLSDDEIIKLAKKGTIRSDYNLKKNNYFKEEIISYKITKRKFPLFYKKEAVSKVTNYFSRKK